MSLNKLSGEQIEQADTTKLGVVQMATDAEVATGTETTKPISVKQLTDTKDAINAAKQDNLTTAQLAAANSGIDSTKVAQIEANKEDIAEIEEDLYGWQKPADWIDIRSGALPNSVYFLVAHNADYTSYKEFVISATVSNSGTYDVFVDGIMNASAVASGTATTLNWQTLALDSGFDVTYPSALRTHIVRIAPTSSSNSFSRITSGAATTRDQGTLWVHSTCSQQMDIYYMLFGEGNYRHPLCEAFTTNQETFKSNWPEYAFAYTNLKTAPVIELTNPGNITGIFEGTKLKKAVFKNAKNNGGSGIGFSAYTEQWECIGGAVKAAWSTFAELPNLKKIQGALSFAGSNDCNNMFYKTSNVQTPLFLDASDGTSITRLTLGGSTDFPLRFVKGLTVSGSAPFSNANSPQLSVAYSGMDRAALVNLFNSMPYNVAYRKIGSPTIVDGVASNFSANNAIRPTSNLPLANANIDIEIAINANTIPNNAQQRVFSCGGLYIRTLGSDPFWNIYFGEEASAVSMGLVNTYPYIKIIRTSGIWYCYRSSNGSSYEQVGTPTAGAALETSWCSIGGGDSLAWAGSVNLNNTYIKVGGKPFFGPGVTKNLVPGGTVVGSPTITDGIASGFSSSKYIRSSSSSTIGSTVELGLKFNMSSVDSSTNVVFNCSNYMLIAQSDWLNSVVYVPGGQQPSNTTITQISANTDYWVKLIFTSNSVEKYYSLDGVSYTYVDTVSVDASVVDFGTSNFGTNLDGYIHGSIDLNNTYIKVGNDYVYRGMVQQTKTCSVVGCTGTSNLTVDDKAIATGKGWELTVA